MEIPKQLQNPEFRFCLLGKWDKWKNSKTGEIKKFPAEEYSTIDQNIWKPLGKAPFENGWQNKGYTFDDPKLLKHIEDGFNFGIIGGYGGLIILDKDSEDLPIDLDTFTTLTGSGGKHYYILSDYPNNHVFINEMGEVRAKNYQVVGIGSIHPNGNKYKISKDLPILKIQRNELADIIEPYLRKNNGDSPSGRTIFSGEGSVIDKAIKGEDTSRSGLEFRKVLSLLRKGKSREDIYKEMTAYSKWSTAPEAYKSMTFEKAEAFHLEEKEKKEKNGVNVGDKLRDYVTKSDLAEQLWKVKPYFYDKSGLWWLWNSEESKWEKVDDTDILIMVSKNSIANTISSKEKNEIVEAMVQYGRQKIPKNIHKTWIQFKNEVYDVKNGEMIKASPEYFVTNPIPYKVSGNPSTPTIDKIFSEWVGPDYVKTLHEIIAYCLIPDYPIHRLFCFIGGGMNGKSCYLNLIRKFIGIKNVTATELDILLSSRFEITRLYKKLVCIMGETNFSELSKTSIIKKLTGADTIGFEFKGKNPFEDLNYSKILIATNNLPTTTDKTVGFYRRWLIIDFPNQFSEKKDILSDIPEEEFENLATQCICDLNDLLTKKEFSGEGSIEERMKRYEDHSDPLEKFLKEYTIEEPDGFIWKFEFEKRLNEWCKENRFRTMSEMVIGKKMKDKNIEQRYILSDWLTDGIQKQFRAWSGIKWKDFMLKTQATQGTQVISDSTTHMRGM